MAVPKPRNGPGANSTLSVAAMLRGPCELFSTDGHFGPLRVAYDGAFELWNRFYGDFVDLAAASPNVLVLRYEDILRNETGAIREIAARARCALDAKFAQTSGKSLVPRKVGPQVAHGDLPSKAVQLNQAWRASWSQAERSQTVSVEASTDDVAVRITDRRGPVPGLLQGSVEVEEQLFFWFGNRGRHHQQQRFVHSSAGARIQF